MLPGQGGRQQERDEQNLQQRREVVVADQDLRQVEIDKHQQQLDSMQKSIKTLTNSIKSNEIDVREDLLLISKELDLYRYNFRQVVVLTRNRGFKDYGKEGDMREIAHFLETSGKVSMIDLLTLRKHEKDYISRKETIYVDNFETVMASMQQKNTDVANFNDAIFHHVILNSTGANVNGGAGYQSFDDITNLLFCDIINLLFYDIINLLF